MQTTEDLKRRIRSAEDLLGVVKTMKALAATSIRQYQRAVESLAEYYRTVELGLQIVLRKSRETPAPTGAKAAWLGAIVFLWAQPFQGQQVGAEPLEVQEVHESRNLEGILLRKEGKS